MNPLLRIVPGSLLMLAAGISFFYSHQLQQKNPETLFLTQQSIDAYEDFQSRAPALSSIIIKIEEPMDRYGEVAQQLKDLGPGLITLGPMDFFSLSQILPASVAQAMKLAGPDYFAFMIKAEGRETGFHEAIATITQRLEGLSYKIAGIPYTNYLLDNYSAVIKEQLFPILFGTAFLLLMIMTRSWWVSLLLFLPALFAAIHTLSCIQFFYGSMNMVTSTLPLIAFTINLSLALHVFYSLSECSTLRGVLKYKWQPISLMIVTTSVGFGSLYVSKIQVIRDFAFISCFIIVITAIATCAWMFVWDGYLKKKSGKAPLGFIKEAWFLRSIPTKWIYLVSGLFVLTGLMVFPKIPILTDATRYFPVSSQLKEKIDDVSTTVVGIPIFDLLLDPKEDLEPLLNDLKRMEFTQPYQLLASNAFASVPAAQIPPSLQFFKSGWTTTGEERILLLGKPNNYDEYSLDLEKLKTRLKDTSSEINGLYYHLMISQKAMIEVLFKSFAISLLIVALLAFASSRELKVLWIFLFVNIVPALISITLLYLLNNSINIATIMTFSIAMGVIVDSTFHMLHALKNEELSHHAFVKTTVVPILFSSVLFVICFGIFVWDEFIPIHQFGQNLSIILFLGLIFDLFVLPTLYLGHHHIHQVFNGNEP